MPGRLNIRITGEVQSVFFRQSAKKEAERLSLSGFARNEPDGSVYIEAEGDEAALKEFAIWCRQGPRDARVDKVSVEEDAIVGHKNFEIK